jgi:23S rRNA (adenine2030-N6)-methyltransferase
MNYRHAFHAGNFADVHKHAVLVRILTHLRLKPAAFRVIDTHAGAGRYDLLGPESLRSGEWREGIGRVFAARRSSDVDALLAPYLDTIAAFNPNGDTLRVYPGSPLIARHLLRPQDRLMACELEPQAAALLAAALRGDAGAKALMTDGWTALNAFVPPKERRGLVLIDPPFEDPDDFARLWRVLGAACRKWPTGIYMLWYPIKDRAAPDALARQLQRSVMPNLLRCELNLGAPRTPGGLVGSGLIVVNPPFTLEADLRLVMPVLCGLLAPQGSFRVDRLAQRR